MSIQDVTTGLVNLASTLLGRNDSESEPVRINFKAGDCEVHGAEVTETAWFCDTWNFKVAYTFVGYDGCEHVMTQWIAQGGLI